VQMEYQSCDDGDCELSWGNGGHEHAHHHH
jgi:cobalt-zinc-cadmium efflux system protein